MEEDRKIKEDKIQRELSYMNGQLQAFGKEVNKNNYFINDFDIYKILFFIIFMT